MKIVLGTMNFGPQLDLEASRTMTESFLKTGNKELDTAYVYNGGDTEKYLGEILPNLDGYYLATKVHPRITGKLDRECILMEFNESLKNCETPEARDAMRAAQVFVNAVNVDSKYDNTAFIIGLSAILSKNGVGPLETLKKMNPKLFEKSQEGMRF